MEGELLAGVLDEVLFILEQSVWAFLWAATLICLLALAFGAAERAAQSYRSSGSGQMIVTQTGAGRTLGFLLMAAGLGGLILCIAVWAAFFGDVGRWFNLLLKRMQEANANEVAVLVASVVSMLVFDFGAYKYLSSERSAPRPAP